MPASSRPASLHVISLKKLKGTIYLVGRRKGKCSHVLVFIDNRFSSLVICDLLHLTPIDSNYSTQTRSLHTVTMSLFMRVIHLGQAVLSGYAAYHSYNAITNLQAYEATSEKLAEWSNEAAKQLAQTRATQTTGALAVCSTS